MMVKMGISPELVLLPKMKTKQEWQAIKIKALQIRETLEDLDLEEAEGHFDWALNELDIAIAGVVGLIEEHEEFDGKLQPVSDATGTP